jgi:N6-L-threonylcarbamoyladenine synthase
VSASPTSPQDRLPPRRLLALETSCDETAAAVVAEDLSVLSNVVSSQVELHARYGGVVPEVASRAHLTQLLPVVDKALAEARTSLSELSAIAVATHPGLVGSLLVGLTAAKSLALALDLPLVAVNHIEAHLFACRMHAGRPVFPAIGLVVSGGHTNLYDCPDSTGFELLGSTIDDAAGEAFDKTATLLGLGYPGGPNIERAARTGNPRAYAFPRSFLKDPRLEFSFSGLKTAVLYEVAGKPPRPDFSPAEIPPQRIADLAASFQAAVVDVLVAKCRQALRSRGRRTLLVGGGVAANGALRQALAQLARDEQIDIITPPLDLCTDNAAMCAVAWEQLRHGHVANLDLDVSAGLVRKRDTKKG